MQTFKSFAHSNKGVFETVGLSQDDVLTKMRLMALLGLGAKASTVSFQDVQVLLSLFRQLFLYSLPRT